MKTIERFKLFTLEKYVAFYEPDSWNDFKNWFQYSLKNHYKENIFLLLEIKKVGVDSGYILIKLYNINQNKIMIACLDHYCDYKTRFFEIKKRNKK